MKRELLLIINPISGVDYSKEEVVNLLTKQLPDDEISVFETSGHDDPARIKETIKTKQWDAVLVGGGDGTINMVASILEGKEIPVGLLPLGSANGLASCLDINNLNQAIKTIQSGKTKDIDCIQINNHICLHLSDFGFNAGLIRRFNKSDERGMMAYLKSSLEEFSEIQPYRFMVQTDEHASQEIEARMLVIANGDRYGTGAFINPQAKMDDGMFEIIALNPANINHIAELSLDLFGKNVLNSPYVKSWQTKSATITNPDNAPFQIDGEVVNNIRKIDINCHPAQFNIFVL